jgi:tetratricopeptide (TPR) repeat protein
MFFRSSAPALPQLPPAETLAVEVRATAQQALDDLVDDRRNPTLWGRFGMICEANGLVGEARHAYATATLLDPTTARWWYRLANTDARVGALNDAIVHIRRAIDVDPSYAPAHRRLGFWLLDRDDVDGAEREFARAAALDPNDPSASAGLARVYLRRHQERAAIDTLERALARAAGDSYLLQLLGTAYAHAGRTDEATTALAAGQHGEPAWADPWTDEMLQFRRGFAVRLKDATAYFMAGQMDRALSLLEQLRQERPDDLALLDHLGEVYVAAGRTDEGIKALETVVARDPQRAQAWVNLAVGYVNRGDIGKARIAIDRAAALNPSLARAHEVRGLVLWRGGNEQAALQEFRAAAQDDPRSARALVFAAMVEMNLSKPRDAIETFARATRLDPARVDAWVGMANAAMALGDLDEATAALDHAIHLKPDDPGVRQSSQHLQTLRAHPVR